MASAVDLFVALKFVKLLTTDWKDWPAFKLGLIDEKGVKKRKAKTDEERKAMGIFQVLTKNIKKLLEKIPFGKTKLASYATGLFLIKEELGDEQYEVLQEAFVIFVDEEYGVDIEDLTESTNDEIDILLPGKYELINEELPSHGAVFITSETLDPIDNILGVAIFEATDIIGKRRVVFAKEDINSWANKTS